MGPSLVAAQQPSELIMIFLASTTWIAAASAVNAGFPMGARRPETKSRSMDRGVKQFALGGLSCIELGDDPAGAAMVDIIRRHGTQPQPSQQ
jgi:hypothetical protein